MNVLLLQSFLSGNETPIYPLGLACLKSELEGMNVRVFDPNIQVRHTHQLYPKLSEIVSSFQPDVVGISLRNIDSTNKRKVVFYYEEFVNLLAQLKSLTSAVIVVGGTGFSMFADVIMTTRPEIDYGIYLEGEKTFPVLLQNLTTPQNVPSVYYRRDQEIVFTGTREKIPFENIRVPDMTAVPLTEFSKFPESIGVETKRGCPFQCIYCPYGFLNGRSYRLRDPERIVDGLESMVKTTGLSSFAFTDSIFNIPVDHAKAILKEMIRRKLNLQWSAWFNERELDRDFIHVAIKAGCRNFIFSPDGFSDITLNKLGKQISKRDILRGFRLMSDTKGCEISYNFFKNPPGQSLTAFIALVLFCIKAKWRMGKRVHFEFNSLRVEPHTLLYDLAVSEKIIPPGDDVLRPVYYTQKKTIYIEKLFNLALKLIGK